MGIHEAELCIASVPRVNSERSVLPDSASELVSLGFIKNCTWVTAGLGPGSWRAWISRASAQLPAQWRWALPSPPSFLRKAHSADHYCCLCRLSPPTNPYRACWLKAKSPWANNCYLKLYFIFLSRCFFFFPPFPDDQPVHWESVNFRSLEHAKQQGIEAAEWHKQQYPSVNAVQCSRAS